MATIKEQDIVLVSKEPDGTKVIQMPITRVENVEGGVATVNGVKPDTSKNVFINEVNNAKEATHAVNADNATKATQDASGNVITTTYATKTEVSKKQDTATAFTKAAADNLYLGKTDTAVNATKALQDHTGKNIVETYATKTKVDADLASVNQTINQGLAGKEDKGVCLPLTGGNITGHFTFGNKHSIRWNLSKEFSGLEVCGGLEWLQGAGLFLRNISATNPEESGTWGLVCQIDPSKGQQNILLGRKNGLFYNGRTVETVVHRSGHDLGNGGVDVWRFESGLMLINGSIVIAQDQLSRTITFPLPFLTDGYGVGITAHTPNCDCIVSFSNPSPNSLMFFRKHVGGGINFNLAVKFNLIGFWK